MSETGIVTDRVERYLADLIPLREGAAAEVAAEMEAHAREHRFPIVGPLVGPFLRLLAGTAGARRVFECGSGFGYSALWFAQAVGPDGEVFLTDTDPENLARARKWLDSAGLGERCRYLTGDALARLRETEGPFDIIFVDIDKEGYPASLPVTMEKLRPGGLLITDNVLWSGRVAEAEPREEATRAIREYNRLLYAREDLEPVLLPLRDGLAVCRRS